MQRGSKAGMLFYFKGVVSEGMSRTRIQMLGGPRTGGGAGEPETQRRAPIECLSRALD